MYVCVKNAQRRTIASPAKPTTGRLAHILLSVDSDSANNEHITMIVMTNIEKPVTRPPVCLWSAVRAI